MLSNLNIGNSHVRAVVAERKNTQAFKLIEHKNRTVNYTKNSIAIAKHGGGSIKL